MKEAQLQALGALAQMTSDKEKRSGDLALSLSEDKDSLDDAEDEFANSSKFLKNMADTCARKAAERDMRAKMRNDEITAVGEAIGVLTDDEARDTLKSALPGAALLATKAMRP